MSWVLSVLGILLGVYLGFVCLLVVSGLVYCRFMRRFLPPDAHQEQVLASVGRGPGLLDRAVGLAVEIRWQAVGMSLQIVHALGLLRMPRGPEGGPPVVLLPGYTETAGNMWRLGRRLGRAGYQPHFVEFPSTFAPMARNADFLEAELERICAHAGVERVAVVAHSMGGVITRSLMLRDPAAHRVGVLVAYASPFRGTYMASLAALLRLGASTRDMAVGSPFLAAHAAAGSDAGAPVLSVVALQEDIISPEWSSIVPGCDVHVLATPVGHEAPLFSDEGFAPVVPFLEAAGYGPHVLEQQVAELAR